MESTTKEQTYSTAELRSKTSSQETEQVSKYQRTNRNLEQQEECNNSDNNNNNNKSKEKQLCMIKLSSNSTRFDAHQDKCYNWLRHKYEKLFYLPQLRKNSNNSDNNTEHNDNNMTSKESNMTNNKTLSETYEHKQHEQEQEQQYLHLQKEEHHPIYNNSDALWVSMQNDVDVCNALHWTKFTFPTDTQIKSTHKHDDVNSWPVRVQLNKLQYKQEEEKEEKSRKPWLALERIKESTKCEDHHNNINNNNIMIDNDTLNECNNVLQERKEQTLYMHILVDDVKARETKTNTSMSNLCKRHDRNISNNNSGNNLCQYYNVQDLLTESALLRVFERQLMNTSTLHTKYVNCNKQNNNNNNFCKDERSSSSLNGTYCNEKIHSVNANLKPEMLLAIQLPWWVLSCTDNKAQPEYYNGYVVSPSRHDAARFLIYPQIQESKSDSNNNNDDINTNKLITWDDLVEELFGIHKMYGSKKKKQNKEKELSSSSSFSSSLSHVSLPKQEHQQVLYFLRGSFQHHREQSNPAIIVQDENYKYYNNNNSNNENTSCRCQRQMLQPHIEELYYSEEEEEQQKSQKTMEQERKEQDTDEKLNDNNNAVNNIVSATSPLSMMELTECNYNNNNKDSFIVSDVNNTKEKKTEMICKELKHKKKKKTRLYKSYNGSTFSLYVSLSARLPHTEQQESEEEQNMENNNVRHKLQEEEKEEHERLCGNSKSTSHSSLRTSNKYGTQTYSTNNNNNSNDHENSIVNNNDNNNINNKGLALSEHKNKTESKEVYNNKNANIVPSTHENICEQTNEHIGEFYRHQSTLSMKQWPLVKTSVTTTTTIIIMRELPAFVWRQMKRWVAYSCCADIIDLDGWWHHRHHERRTHVVSNKMEKCEMETSGVSCTWHSCSLGNPRHAQKWEFTATDILQHLHPPQKDTTTTSIQKQKQQEEEEEEEGEYYEPHEYQIWNVNNNNLTYCEDNNCNKENATHVTMETSITSSLLTPNVTRKANKSTISLTPEILINKEQEEELRSCHKESQHQKVVLPRIWHVSYYDTYKSKTQHFLLPQWWPCTHLPSSCLIPHFISQTSDWNVVEQAEKEHKEREQEYEEEELHLLSYESDAEHDKMNKLEADDKSNVSNKQDESDVITRKEALNAKAAASSSLATMPSLKRHTQENLQEQQSTKSEQVKEHYVQPPRAMGNYNWNWSGGVGIEKYVTPYDSVYNHTNSSRISSYSNTINTKANCLESILNHVTLFGKLQSSGVVEVPLYKQLVLRLRHDSAITVPLETCITLPLFTSLLSFRQTETHTCNSNSNNKGRQIVEMKAHPYFWATQGPVWDSHLIRGFENDSYNSSGTHMASRWYALLSLELEHAPEKSQSINVIKKKKKEKNDKSSKHRKKINVSKSNEKEKAEEEEWEQEKQKREESQEYKYKNTNGVDKVMKPNHNYKVQDTTMSISKAAHNKTQWLSKLNERSNKHETTVNNNISSNNNHNRNTSSFFDRLNYLLFANICFSDCAFWRYPRASLGFSFTSPLPRVFIDQFNKFSNYHLECSFSWMVCFASRTLRSGISSIPNDKCNKNNNNEAPCFRISPLEVFRHVRCGVTFKM